MRVKEAIAPGFELLLEPLNDGAIALFLSNPSALSQGHIQKHHQHKPNHQPGGCCLFVAGAV